MKRGVIGLTKDEVNDVYKRVDLEVFTKSPLSNKFRAAIESPEIDVSIEVSEEELEFILDEIIIPDATLDTDATKTLREKIQKLLQEFREQDTSWGVI